MNREPLRITQTADGHWLVYAVECVDGIVVERIVGQVTKNGAGTFGAHRAHVGSDVPHAIEFGGAESAADRIEDAARLLLPSSAAVAA